MKRDLKREDSEYEYASFVWNKETERYEQCGKAVLGKLLCKQLFYRRIKPKYRDNPCYDTEKVIFKKRLVATISSEWEEL